MIALAEARTPDDYQVARGLILAYAAWLGLDLGFQGFDEELEELPAVYGPPGGCLLIAREGADPVGVVGVRARSSRECEMKRLFVQESARGRGVGRALAEQAVRAARRLGYRRMVLDTLETMTGALALYAALGFRETPAYYANPLPRVCYLALEL
jgi:GNAT superfamily N-acetyltransferase